MLGTVYGIINAYVMIPNLTSIPKLNGIQFLVRSIIDIMFTFCSVVKFPNTIIIPRFEISSHLSFVSTIILSIPATPDNNCHESNYCKKTKCSH